jgi:transcriptional regulator with XRE-family HTH domain
MVETRGSVLLRRWLEDSGTSQAALAERMGVFQTSVSGWVRGAQPRARFVSLLEEVAGIPPEAWAQSAKPLRKAG